MVTGRLIGKPPRPAQDPASRYRGWRSTNTCEYLCHTYAGPSFARAAGLGLPPAIGLASSQSELSPRSRPLSEGRAAGSAIRRAPRRPRADGSTAMKATTADISSLRYEDDDRRYESRRSSRYEDEDDERVRPEGGGVGVARDLWLACT